MSLLYICIYTLPSLPVVLSRAQIYLYSWEFGIFACGLGKKHLDMAKTYICKSDIGVVLRKCVCVCIIYIIYDHLLFLVYDETKGETFLRCLADVSLSVVLFGGQRAWGYS